MVDLLYVAFNRLEFTRQSFEALIANTNWELVNRLLISDDGSTDGTSEYLGDARERVPIETFMRSSHIGGPVAATNWYLDHSGGVATFGKIDNDFVVCPGWLDEMTAVLDAHPGLDILGMEPMLGEPTLPPLAGRGIEDATHIGGKGLVRLRAFERCGRPTPTGQNGYFGFTEWQHYHPEIAKAWIAPDLPVFGLDQLPIDRWRELTDEYVAKGWQRRWPEYNWIQTDVWEWWTPVP